MGAHRSQGSKLGFPAASAWATHRFPQLRSNRTELDANERFCSYSGLKRKIKVLIFAII